MQNTELDPAAFLVWGVYASLASLPYTWPMQSSLSVDVSTLSLTNTSQFVMLLSRVAAIAKDRGSGAVTKVELSLTILSFAYPSSRGSIRSWYQLLSLRTSTSSSLFVKFSFLVFALLLQQLNAFLVLPPAHPQQVFC